MARLYALTINLYSRALSQRFSELVLAPEFGQPLVFEGYQNLVVAFSEDDDEDEEEEEDQDAAEDLVSIKDKVNVIDKN